MSHEAWNNYETSVSPTVYRGGVNAGHDYHRNKAPYADTQWQLHQQLQLASQHLGALSTSSIALLETALATPAN